MCIVAYLLICLLAYWRIGVLAYWPIGVFSFVCFCKLRCTNMSVLVSHSNNLCGLWFSSYLFAHDFVNMHIGLLVCYSCAIHCFCFDLDVYASLSLITSELLKRLSIFSMKSDL